MTTIAYRDGVLASDSRLTFVDYVCTDKCIKVWALPDGTLFGASGDNEGGLALLKSLRAGEPMKTEVDSDFTAIRILPKGQIFITEGKLWDRWPERFVAIGSGGKYALAAMRSGADAVTAVKAGIALDIYSGGRIQQVKLKRKPK
jgi:ATP-dependent protease HslVU (ClpYQ) peptidase subunit